MAVRTAKEMRSASPSVFVHSHAVRCHLSTLLPRLVASDGHAAALRRLSRWQREGHGNRLHDPPDDVSRPHDAELVEQEAELRLQVSPDCVADLRGKVPHLLLE